ncbi:MAG TPA: HesA/MoeB/ThiF family protein, partial [Spirochaetota bacterium]|nr:HesA/MoeB/ThiF family protein [Spirochaetota bacterium]
QVTTMLSQEERELYQRQLIINGWGKEAQEKIKNTHLFIAGAGGLASPAALYCAVAGFGKITICDFDTISLSNLNRQILHNHTRMGMHKADSAYATLTQTNPYIHVEIKNIKITTRNIQALIENSHIILDCLDNFETRHILNKACFQLQKPLIHAGVEGFSGQLTVVIPHQTPCLSCFLPKKSNKKPIPIVGVTPGVMGTLQAMEAIKLVTGLGAVTTGKLLLFDGLAMRFSSISLEQNPACKVCGK